MRNEKYRMHLLAVFPSKEKVRASYEKQQQRKEARNDKQEKRQ